MNFYYERLEHNEQLQTFENNQTICKSLAYMVTFKEHENLKVIPKKNSIEIFNDKLVLSIILYVGFEQNEFIENKNKKNFHMISFGKHTNEMHEFKKLKNEIKFIEPKALFFTALSYSKNKFCDDLKTILEL